jgi:hypothetical protein
MPAPLLVWSGLGRTLSCVVHEGSPLGFFSPTVGDALTIYRRHIDVKTADRALPYDPVSGEKC